MGGVQTVAFEIAQFLKGKEWNVHVVTNRYPRSLKSKETNNDLEIRRFLLLHSPTKYLKSGRLDLFFGWVFSKPFNLIRLFIFFKKNNPKLVHIHFPDNQIFESLLLQKYFGFKSIISFHGNDIEKISKQTSFRFKMITSLLIKADLITGCSEYVLNQIKDKFPIVDERKLMPLYNGVSKNFLNVALKTSKSDYIFSAGRFVPNKGLNILSSLFLDDIKRTLIIAGGLKDEFIKNGNTISNNVSLVGKLNPKEISQYLQNSNLTVVPSINESFGIFIAEALCCGSPVISTNVGGIPELISIAQKGLDNDEKIIFNQWVKLVSPTAEAISKGINSVLDNCESIKDFLLLIPKIRKQFQWDERLKEFNLKINELAE